jgi:hypothetical protein
MEKMATTTPTAKMMDIRIDDILFYMIDKKRSIEKIVQKRSLYEPKGDAAWWRAQPYMMRLAALEEIRQEVHRWKYGAEPRFQRVYRIVKLK